MSQTCVCVCFKRAPQGDAEAEGPFPFSCQVGENHLLFWKWFWKFIGHAFMLFRIWAGRDFCGIYKILSKVCKLCVLGFSCYTIEDTYRNGLDHRSGLTQRYCSFRNVDVNSDSWITLSAFKIREDSLTQEEKEIFLDENNFINKKIFWENFLVGESKFLHFSVKHFVNFSSKEEKN